MQADILNILSDWRYPVWSLSNLAVPHTLTAGAGIIGVVNESAEAYDWHLHSTDEKGIQPSLDQAKAACELAFWRKSFEDMRLAATDLSDEHQADVAVLLEGWELPEWEQDEEEVDMWLLRQRNHRPVNIVGEVYGIGDAVRWRCMTSDQRVVVEDVDLAKLQCEASFWRDAWERVRIAATGWFGAPCYTPKIGSPMSATAVHH